MKTIFTVKEAETGILWSFIFQSPREFHAFHFLGTDSGLCIYHFSAWVNFSFLHNLQWITLFNFIVPSLVILLCKLAAFAYYVINNFIPVITEPVLSILGIINFRFEIVYHNMIFILLLKIFSFSFEASTSKPFSDHLILLSFHST